VESCAIIWRSNEISRDIATSSFWVTQVKTVRIKNAPGERGFNS
jgi:hypothetical protein